MWVCEPSVDPTVQTDTVGRWREVNDDEGFLVVDTITFIFKKEEQLMKITFSFHNILLIYNLLFLAVISSPFPVFFLSGGRKEASLSA